MASSVKPTAVPPQRVSAGTSCVKLQAAGGEEGGRGEEGRVAMGEWRAVGRGLGQGWRLTAG